MSFTDLCPLLCLSFDEIERYWRTVWTNLATFSRTTLIEHVGWNRWSLFGSFPSHPFCDAVTFHWPGESCFPSACSPGHAAHHTCYLKCGAWTYGACDFSYFLVKCTSVTHSLPYSSTPYKAHGVPWRRPKGKRVKSQQVMLRLISWSCPWDGPNHKPEQVTDSRAPKVLPT